MWATPNSGDSDSGGEFAHATFDEEHTAEYQEGEEFSDVIGGALSLEHGAVRTWVPTYACRAMHSSHW